MQWKLNNIKRIQAPLKLSLYLNNVITPVCFYLLSQKWQSLSSSKEWNNAPQGLEKSVNWNKKEIILTYLIVYLIPETLFLKQNTLRKFDLNKNVYMKAVKWTDLNSRFIQNSLPYVVWKLESLPRLCTTTYFSKYRLDAWVGSVIWD